MHRQFRCAAFLGVLLLSSAEAHGQILATDPVGLTEMLPDASWLSSDPAAFHLAPDACTLGTPVAWQQWTLRQQALAGALPVADDQSATTGYGGPPPDGAPRTWSDKLSDTALWFVDETEHLVDQSLHDLRNLYTGRNLALLCTSVAIAAPMANTHLDQNFRNWYQKNVYSPGADGWAKVGYWFGQWEDTVPIYVAVMIAGAWFDDT